MTFSDEKSNNVWELTYECLKSRCINLNLNLGWPIKCSINTLSYLLRKLHGYSSPFISSWKKILEFKKMSPLSREFILFFIELGRTFFFDLHICKFNYKVGANVNIDRVSPNVQSWCLVTRCNYRQAVGANVIANLLQRLNLKIKDAN